MITLLSKLIVESVQFTYLKEKASEARDCEAPGVGMGFSVLYWSPVL